MQKIRLGTNPDGSPQYHFIAEPDEHVVITGPYINGDVTLPDGTVVDVTDMAIVADSPQQALAISDAIGERFAAEGHPRHEPDVPFVATPSSVSHTPDGEPSEAFTKAIEKNPTFDATQLIEHVQKGR